MLLISAQWIATLILSIFYRHVFQTEMPRTPSFGVLSYLDSTFVDWSTRLMRRGNLDTNWFTSSKQRCARLWDYFFGHCIHIKHLEEDREALSLLLGLTPFHSFCYVLLRRFAEIICLYLSRWLLVADLIIMVSAGCVLFRNEDSIAIQKDRHQEIGAGKNEKVIHSSKSVPLLAFILSSVIMLSILIPFLLELCLGGILHYQLQSFEGEKSTSSALSIGITALYGKHSSISAYGLFVFHCLKYAVFDLKTSGVKGAVTPSTTLEKLYLQIQICYINWATTICVVVLYAMTVASCYVTMRLLNDILSCVSRRNRSRSRLKTNVKKLYDHPSLETVIEHYEKKILEPGDIRPWQNVKFTTSLQNHSDSKPDSSTAKKKTEDIDSAAPGMTFTGKGDSVTNNSHKVSKSNKECLGTQSTHESSENDRLLKLEAGDSADICKKVRYPQKIRGLIGEASLKKCSSSPSMLVSTNKKPTYVNTGTYVRFDSDESSDSEESTYLGKFSI